MKSSAIVPVVLLAAIMLTGCGTRPAPVYTQWPFDAKEAAKRQDDTAKALGIPKTMTLDLGNKVNMKLVLIPAGQFVMGSPLSERQTEAVLERQHEVTISKPFYMGVYHVTRGQFAAFVADGGYRAAAERAGWGWKFTGMFFEKKNGASWKNTGFEQTDEHPVVCVTYNDAVAFCQWLSKKSGRTVKLPTEARWEYACRAGTNTAFNTGRNTIGRDETNFNESYRGTTPVGRFQPNAWGLYDMHGNAYQWCPDWYDWHYPPGEGPTDPPRYNWDYDPSVTSFDPEGPKSGTLRILRGGSWFMPEWRCRSAYREDGDPSDQYSGYGGYGFRVVVEAK